MTTVAYFKAGRPSSDYKRIAGYVYAKPIPRIVCADGFDVSVQAGRYLYSTPREDAGPWTHVEVGFPSERPEPWDSWKEYAEEADKPTDTVYAYVPVELVADLIAAHGGEVKS